MKPRIVIILILIVYLLGFMWFITKYYKEIETTASILNISTKEVVETFQVTTAQDGSILPNRITSLPSFEDLTQKQKPLPCNKMLDTINANLVNKNINMDKTVGGYCEIVGKLDPIDVIKKVIIPDVDVQITSANMKNSNIQASTTADLPVGYTPVMDKAVRATRKSLRNEELPGAKSFDDSRRPVDLLPNNLTNFEVWIGQSKQGGINYSDLANISAINLKAGPEGTWVNVSGYFIRNALVFTDFIAWDLNDKSIYQLLRENGLPALDDNTVGTNMRMAFIASHPLRRDLLIKGDPTLATLPNDINTINMSLQSSNGGYSIATDTVIFFSSENNDINMLSSLYNISGDRLQRKSEADIKVPFYSWRFSEIKIQNTKTGVFVDNKKNTVAGANLTSQQLDIYLYTYEDVKQYAKAPSNRPYTDEQRNKALEHWRLIGIKGDYEVPGSIVEVDLNAIMMKFLKSGIYFRMMNEVNNKFDMSYDKLYQFASTINPTLPNKDLEVIIRWRFEGQSQYTSRYYKQGSPDSWVTLTQREDIGTRLTLPFQPKFVFDYEIQYTFVVRVKNISNTKGYRNIFNHGKKTDGGVHSFPGLGIMGDDGSDKANHIVLNIMTQDDTLPYGQTVFIPPIPNNVYTTIVVVLKNMDGTIYSSPSTVRTFKLTRPPVWPFIDEAFNIADGNLTNPTDIGENIVSCCPSEQPNSANNTSNLMIKDFRWYPIAIDDENYIRQNFLSIQDTATILTRQEAITVAQGITQSGNSLRGSMEWKEAGNYVFMVPDGIRAIRVLVVGGGGGGGNGIDASNDPPQGGRAGEVKSQILSVIGGSVITLTVGANGRGQTTYASAGTDGGRSSFGTIQALGGNGGQRSVNLDSLGRATSNPPGGNPTGNGEDCILPNGTIIGKGGRRLFNEPSRCNDTNYLNSANATGNGSGGGSMDHCRGRSSGNGAPGYIRVEWGF